MSIIAVGMVIVTYTSKFVHLIKNFLDMGIVNIWIFKDLANRLSEITSHAISWKFLRSLQFINIVMKDMRSSVRTRKMICVHIIIVVSEAFGVVSQFC